MKSRNKRSGFTLIELLVAITIIGILAAIGLGSFSSSQIKARDSRRKADLTNITKALEFYYNDRGQYPANDSQGRIMGCGEVVATPTECTYGGTFALGGTIYMTILPADPKSTRYYYVRDSVNTYRIYAALENTNDIVSILAPSAVVNATDCSVTTGVQPCNYGVSSSNTSPN